MSLVESLAKRVHQQASQILGNPRIGTGENRGQGLANVSGHADSHSSADLKTVMFSIGVLAPIYGAVMGSFGWMAGHRGFAGQLPQIIYSAVKMPLLISVTLVLCIPSFYVFNSIAGLRHDFSESVRAIVSSLASFAIVLLSLAPFTCVFYVSIATHHAAYQLATLFNACLFGIAAASSQYVLSKSFQRLISRNRRHRQMLMAWVIAFAFVGIQLGWTLRPFIGDPHQTISFFRDEPMTNAYIQLIKITRSATEEMLF